MKKVNFPRNTNTLVGAADADDAGIYKINDEQALVHTLDFFTPIVDDPYTFGQIAAANSLSDIYAMGGTPLNALNIVCFPDKELDEDVLAAILQGGADKLNEAGSVILGGHTVQDKELKYGLAVTGIINPNKITLNHNLLVGDKILLTKPIGTGILTTALKNDKIADSELQPVINSMLQLNKLPAQLLDRYNVTGVTDVTGFGLLGHLWEMIQGSNFGVNLYVSSIPTFDNVREFAADSMYIPGGTLANINFLEKNIKIGNIPITSLNYLCDPQTSGGLLISISADEYIDYIEEMKDYNWNIYVIGEVVSGENKISLV